MQEYLDMLVGLVKMYAVNIVLALVIVIVGKWVAKWLQSMLKKTMLKRNTDETLTNFVANLLYGLLMAVILIAALDRLGVETMSLVAIFGAAGLAIGLALQGSLANFASGIMLIIFRPFKKDDFIEVAGIQGSVKEIQIFVTTLNTLDNRLVILPNSKVFGDSIVNFSANDVRRVDLVFGISYGDDVRRAKDVFMDILRKDPLVLEDPEPTVGVLELGDSSVNFAVRPWVKTADYWTVYFAVTEEVKVRLDAEGISIPFPQHDIHMIAAN